MYSEIKTNFSASKAILGDKGKQKSEKEIRRSQSFEKKSKIQTKVKILGKKSNLREKKNLATKTILRDKSQKNEIRSLF